MQKSWLWMMASLVVLALSFVLQAHQLGSGGGAADVRGGRMADVDHAAIIGSWDEEALERGRVIYRDNCAVCHGMDGVESMNPLSPAFATVDTLQNGHDPYRLWQTLTEGYGAMPAQTWLTPEQRYDVVHYLREAFFKPHNPDLYTPVNEAYLATLPQGGGEGAEATATRPAMTYGPALTYELDSTRSALALPLSGRLSLHYDLHTMDVPAAWTGGFVDLDGSHHVEYKGSERARRPGRRLGLGPLRWGWQGRFADPREGGARYGPMPEERVAYRGHYLHGDQTVLSYAVEGRDVLDLPEDASSQDVQAVAHTLRIGPGEAELTLSAGRTSGPLHVQGFDDVHQPDGRRGGTTLDVRLEAKVVWAGEDAVQAFAVAGDVEGVLWETESEGGAVLRIPPDTSARLLKLFRATGPDVRSVAAHLDEAARDRVVSPEPLTKGGPPRWKEEITTAGTLGTGEGAYALDRIGLPTGNPWGSWMRLTDLDFFPDGRGAVSTLNGDVWVVSGLDEKLDSLRWRRFATGLYEPLGLAIKEGDVYVLGRDRITRLHDLDGDGEADFYENFYPFEHVSAGYHAFTFGLHVGPDGHFYTMKSGRKTDYDLPGALLRIAPDGRRSEVVATGFRHPNGMSIGPGGDVFVSDNQGSWIPASKVSRIRPGGFYGYVREGEAAPAHFDPPMFWLPQEADNSSGGQAWVPPDVRWGPLAGTMVHTSYGAARAFYAIPQEIEGAMQAAVVPFPWTFPSGVMRARVNPADGQVYLVGLKGWDTSAQEDASFNRIRYTGSPDVLVEGAAVTPEGLRLRFTAPLDPIAAADPARYDVRRWNYKWTEVYGSPHYLPSDTTRTTEGEEVVTLDRVDVAEDRRSVLLHLPDHRPVDQVRVRLALEAADGTPAERVVYFTINRIPSP